MEKIFTLSVPEEEAIRLYRILLDRDKDEALAFLEENAKKPLHTFFDSG